MVIVEKKAHATEVTVLPNRSASWSQTKYFLKCFAVLSLIIAGYWTYRGAWVVIPFAIIQIGVFSLLMYKVSWSTYRKQFIQLNQTQVLLQTGVNEVEHEWRFNLKETYVLVYKPRQRFEPIQIILKDEKTRVEIGDFLNFTDKENLVDAFRDNHIRIIGGDNLAKGNCFI